ncbi:hypothetical protein LENED_010361 [Lentinula edodes]|uniref:Uncharacterized protein n=1 Tax=Lentinula edodes TaxID=5353 RepID=A0A1Q3EM97_LENED|nr:hypothetical protein LENED_010361 [Lentinula edodes]
MSRYAQGLSSRSFLVAPGPLQLSQTSIVDVYYNYDIPWLSCTQASIHWLRMITMSEWKASRLCATIMV